MKSEVHPGVEGEDAPAGGLAVGDILFTIFRHKILILSSVVLGIIAAGSVRFIKPPNYESTAQVYLPWVVEIPGVNPNDPVTGFTPTGAGGTMQLDTEADILRSFDTATKVASVIGPERILAAYGGGSNLLAAAGVVAGGISVAPPKTMSLSITFAHRDPEIVQPILQAIMEVYMHRHKKLRLPDVEEFEAKRNEAGQKLAEVEERITALKVKAGAPDLKQRREAVAKELIDLQTKTIQVKVELSRRKAELGQLGETINELQATSLPSEAVSKYSDVLSDIEEIKQRKRTMLFEQDVTTNHPSVLRLDVKMNQQLQLKEALEREFPVLTNYAVVTARASGSTNSPWVDLETELLTLKKLERTIEANEAMAVNLTQESFQLMETERELADLERVHKSLKADYDYYTDSIDTVKRDDTGSGKIPNIKPLQAPTPPSLNKKKMLKLVGAAFVGCAGLGVGLAFLMDMVLDRTIRRPSQIVRALHLPVVLTIHDVERAASAASARNKNRKLQRTEKTEQAGNFSLAGWAPDNLMQSHIEGLRERVITHFEVNGPDVKPKLVGVTGCTEGAGVTSLASGLAVSLSRTVNGAVLLVDSSSEQSVMRSFYKGKPGYGPSLAPEEDAEKSENENLSLTKVRQSSNGHDRLAGIFPEFDNSSPRLKADAYDYVVFDMDRVTPASMTPRLSGRMDLVLFVIEAGRTKDYTAKEACGLLRESRAKVAAILNKYHNPVPEWLAQY